jgi:hypothetical protein
MRTRSPGYNEKLLSRLWYALSGRVDTEEAYSVSDMQYVVVQDGG